MRFPHSGSYRPSCLGSLHKHMPGTALLSCFTASRIFGPGVVMDEGRCSLKGPSGSQTAWKICCPRLLLLLLLSRPTSTLVSTSTISTSLL
ncbi:hypothetical protein CGRA01v4_04710 [Colletotrichum graminicola]|nr:hypothetical protein CGRA01v4_04710 [Colletotrichum graminicola]